MDGNTQIGKVSSFVLKTSMQTSSEGDITFETTLNKNLVPNENATYQNVDTAMRALVTLSSNNYVDTICVTNISVSDVLAG